MAVRPRINSTLFDKLASDSEMYGLQEEAAHTGDLSREAMKRFPVVRAERFNEEALRLTVRRELSWLLNTVNLAAAVDLAPYPQVQTSVLNYGVPDMAGKATTNRAIMQRARDIRSALLAFEPRLERASLTVEASDNVERENSITFVIRGDITAAVNALPVKLATDVEIDTAAVTVRD